MQLEEAQEKFIQSWGTLGSHWGINRTMAQVHALLLVSAHPLSAQQIMDALKISSGNANMNIRALIDWGLVFKELKPGERKEFFVAEKDMWEVVRKITIQRKKKELEPVIRVLNEISEVEENSPEAEEFVKVVEDIRTLAQKADSTLEGLVKSDQKWFVGTFLNLIK